MTLTLIILMFVTSAMIAISAVYTAEPKAAARGMLRQSAFDKGLPRVDGMMTSALGASGCMSLRQHLFRLRADWGIE